MMYIFSVYYPRRDFAQKAKSRGGTLARILRKVLTVETDSQHARKKIPICLNRGREEWVSNDDVSVACARKYEMVKMT